MSAPSNATGMHIITSCNMHPCCLVEALITITQLYFGFLSDSDTTAL